MKVRVLLMGKDGVTDSGPIELEPDQVINLTVWFEGRPHQLGQLIGLADDETAAGIDQFLAETLRLANSRS